MSAVHSFKQFVSERLAAAAEEIVRVFERTIVEYEEHMNSAVWKAEIQLSRTEHPPQHIFKEDLHLCNPDGISSQDQVDPQSPWMKKEQEELKNHLILKQETDIFTLPLTCENGDNTEDQAQCLNSDESQSRPGKEFMVRLVESLEESEPNTNYEHLFCNSHLADSCDHEGSKHGDSVLARNPETEKQITHHKINNAANHTMLKNYSEIHLSQKSFKCDTCGETFQYKSRLIRHMKIHTCEKPYSCSVCGKTFGKTSVLAIHKRIHTGEKLYPCNTCEVVFSNISALKRHVKIHTDERPYVCNTCGRRFRDVTVLNRHMRIHTGQSPYLCNTCGKRFCQLSSLKSHTRIHTGERPFSCKICGKAFRYSGDLSVHTRIHTS